MLTDTKRRGCRTESPLAGDLQVFTDNVIIIKSVCVSVERVVNEFNLRCGSVVHWDLFSVVLSIPYGDRAGNTGVQKYISTPMH